MFPSVIPLSGTDCSRVTHPSAARISTEVNIPARLACVKHAASVRPEPGSNSDVQSLSSTSSLPLRLAKAFGSAPRQGVLLIRNLTVYFLSSIFVSVSFSSFVRRLRSPLATTLAIIAGCIPFVNTFFQLFISFTCTSHFAHIRRPTSNTILVMHI